MQRTFTLLLTLALPQLFACDPATPGDEPEAADDADAADLALAAPIDVEPATHDDASAALAQIDALLSDDPEDARALAALAAIQPRLDELNHLVARVSVAPGHEVSFYEARPGVIFTSESRPLGAARAVDTGTLAAGTVADLYVRLAGDDAAVPEALVAAQARAKDRVAAAPAGDPRQLARPLALSASADEPTAEPLTSADGPWWSANVCYGSEADSKWCLPNWGGGAWAQQNAKTSASAVAPFAGNVVLRAQLGGSSVFTENVLQGNVREAWLNSSWDWDCGIFACSDWDFDVQSHRWDVLDASGDQFHWAAGFNWSCYGSDWDCPWDL